MTTKSQSTGISLSQDDDLTKLVIVVRTKTAKNVFCKVILPAATSCILWFAHNQPIAEGQKPPHTSLAPVAEQTSPYR
jgi:hypothetical protein